MAENQRDVAADAESQGVSVGTAAARLGVTASTLRSWGTRYGIVPSWRSPGGHRRYSPADLEVLDRVQAGIRDGVSPAAAAAAARSSRSDAAASAPSGSEQRQKPGRRGAGAGGRVLAVPGADPVTRGLASSVGRLDLVGAEETLLRHLRERGVVPTWDTMLRPVLVAAGRRWVETGEGIEVEHVVSEATLGALRRRRAELPAPPDLRSVILAAAPGDQHTLILHATAVGLAERDIGAQVFGARVPFASLATAVGRTRPHAVFVSCVVPGLAEPRDLVRVLPRTRPATPVVLGGGGWPKDLPAGVRSVGGLGEALDALAGLVKTSTCDSW